MDRAIIVALALCASWAAPARAQDCLPDGRLDPAASFTGDPFAGEYDGEPPAPPASPSECDVDGDCELPEETLAGFGTHVPGVVLSEASGDVDFAVLAMLETGFVLVRASDGTVEDSRFASLWAGASEASLHRGAFAEWNDHEDPVAQAERLLAIVGPQQPGDLPLGLVAGGATDADAVARFIAVVAAQTGTAPWVEVSDAVQAELALRATDVLHLADATSPDVCANVAPQADFLRVTTASSLPGVATRDAPLVLLRGDASVLYELAGTPGGLPDGAGGGGIRFARPVPLNTSGSDALGVVNRKHLNHTVCGSQVGATCAANRTKFHPGSDLRAPSGTQVRAAASGTVERAVFGCPDRAYCTAIPGMRSNGNNVRIRHSDGSITAYLHLRHDSTPPVRTSAPLDCGAPIGLAGVSGNAWTASAVVEHVHFYWQVRGAYADPFGNPSSTTSGGSCRCVPAPASANRFTASCTATTPADDSRLTRSAVGTGAAGSTVSATGTFENTGTTTWSTSYTLVRVGGTFGPERVALTTPVARSQSRTFTFDVTVPDVAPGATVTARYRLANASGRQFGAELPVRFSRPRETPTTCASATLGRDVPANTCVQRGMGASDGCAWFRCVAGRWTASTETDASCGERHPSATCSTPGSCLSTTLGRSVPEGTCVQRAPGMPGCEWFRCSAGAWTAQTAEQCLFEVAPGAPESTTYRHASCSEWVDPCASDGTTCDDCSARVGCGFCADDGSCRSDFLEGTCTDWRAAWFECVDCDAITDCGECAMNGCGWCASSDQCMPARSGGGPLRPCEDWHYTDTIAWCAANE